MEIEMPAATIRHEILVTAEGVFAVAIYLLKKPWTKIGALGRFAMRQHLSLVRS